MKETGFLPQPGAIRAFIEDVWTEVNPHDSFYPIIAKHASQFWDGKTWRWISKEVKLKTSQIIHDIPTTKTP